MNPFIFLAMLIGITSLSGCSPVPDDKIDCYWAAAKMKTDRGVAVATSACRQKFKDSSSP